MSDEPKLPREVLRRCYACDFLWSAEDTASPCPRCVEHKAKATA